MDSRAGNPIKSISASFNQTESGQYTVANYSGGYANFNYGAEASCDVPRATYIHFTRYGSDYNKAQMSVASIFGEPNPIMTTIILIAFIAVGTVIGIVKVRRKKKETKENV